MVGGPRLSGRDQLFLPFGDERFILAMRRNDNPEFFCQAERVRKSSVVIDPKGNPFVGQEDLEGGNAPADDLRQLLRGSGAENASPPCGMKSRRPISLRRARATARRRPGAPPAVLEGQHISIRLVVPPMRAALLAVS